MFLFGSDSQLCILLLVMRAYYWAILTDSLLVGVVGVFAILLPLRWRVVIEESTLPLISNTVIAHALGLIGPGILQKSSFLEDLIFFKAGGELVSLLERQLFSL